MDAAQEKKIPVRTPNGDNKALHKEVAHNLEQIGISGAQTLPVTAETPHPLSPEPEFGEDHLARPGVKEALGIPDEAVVEIETDSKPDNDLKETIKHNFLGGSSTRFVKSGIPLDLERVRHLKMQQKKAA